MFYNIFWKETEELWQRRLKEMADTCLISINKRKNLFKIKEEKFQNRKPYEQYLYTQKKIIAPIQGKRVVNPIKFII